MMQHLEEIVVPGEFISVLGECIHMLQHLEEMVVTGAFISVLGAIWMLCEQLVCLFRSL
jgi:hypothetical protein